MGGGWGRVVDFLRHPFLQDLTTPTPPSPIQGEGDEHQIEGLESGHGFEIKKEFSTNTNLLL
jgi:hypothetical protein